MFSNSLLKQRHLEEVILGNRKAKKCDRLTPLHSTKHSRGLKKHKKFVIHNLYEDRQTQ